MNLTSIKHKAASAIEQALGYAAQLSPATLYEVEQTVGNFPVGGSLHVVYNLREENPESVFFDNTGHQGIDMLQKLIDWRAEMPADLCQKADAEARQPYPAELLKEAKSQLERQISIPTEKAS